MKQITFGSVLGNDPNSFRRWVEESLREIERASASGVEQIITEYSVSNFTETRTLNAATATASDVANFVATLISDIQKGGQKRAYV